MGDLSLLGIVDTITLEQADSIMSMAKKENGYDQDLISKQRAQGKRQKKEAMSPGIEPDVGVELSYELARESNIKM